MRHVHRLLAYITTRTMSITTSSTSTANANIININTTSSGIHPYEGAGMVRDVPLGVKALHRISNKCFPRLRINREFCYRASVAFLTYIAYMSYHMSRKTISVVKTVLYRNCSEVVVVASSNNVHDMINNMPALGDLGGTSLSTAVHNSSNWCDWAPFDGPNANALLGELDSSFLFCYAFFMLFVSGVVAERVNLRYFLALGMLASGIFSYMFGIAKSYDIHSFVYFVAVQALAGIAQTTGWPGVVTVMSNWFGKGKRGLIFGFWNSHTSIGNIFGTLIAGYYVESDWGLSFMVPGLIMGVIGFILFLFLIVSPLDVGCTINDEQPQRRPSKSNYRQLENHIANNAQINDNYSNLSSEIDDTDIIIGDEEVQSRLTERTRLLATHDIYTQRIQPNASLVYNIDDGRDTERRAIGFIGALRIPGVVRFSLSLFFSKLVSYTFLYWLPQYVKASTSMTAEQSADLSTLFDVGGIFGAIAAGVLSDSTGMSATTCVGMLTLAAPTMFIYQQVGTVTGSLYLNMFILLIVGCLVNGPYALITTSVSAELGTHSSLEGNARALATVTAIIDGTGSIGAAVGPLLAGFVNSYGWQYVFIVLIFSDIVALVLLLPLIPGEIERFRSRRSLRIE